VCIDGNFTQKRLKSKYSDPGLIHPDTYFLPDIDVAAMEALVDAARTGAPLSLMFKEFLPEEILDECERSFDAAQEKIAKASGRFYGDTGLMALVCRHDRLLWIVNLTTPGERQYYAFALIDRLFREIPDDWHVGLLYDIACQLQRSMLKV